MTIMGRVSGRLMTRARIVATALFIGAVINVAGTGGASAVAWGDAIALQVNGFDNPLVIFGFNPQPDPPEDAILSLANPQQPTLSRTNGFTTDTVFDVFFAIGLPNGAGSAYSLRPSALPAGEFGNFQFTAVGPMGNLLIDLGFSTSSSGMGFLTSVDDVSFNPQPEPPFGFAGMAMEMGFTSFSTAVVSLQITDEDGNVFSMRQVPEPGMAAILAIGFAGLVLRRRRRA